LPAEHNDAEDEPPSGDPEHRLHTRR
jgi:hypothetical protein